MWKTTLFDSFGQVFVVMTCKKSLNQTCSISDSPHRQRGGGYVCLKRV